MGISNSAVVVICIVGAAAVLFIGYASTHLFFSREASRSSGDVEAIANGELTQAQYMREVRLRNQETIAVSYGGHGRREFPSYISVGREV